MDDAFASACINIGSNNAKKPSVSINGTGKTNFENIGVGTFVKIAEGLNMNVEELYYGSPVAEDAQRAQILWVYDKTSDEGKKALALSAKNVSQMY